jgi:hypothetical protein
VKAAALVPSVSRGYGGGEKTGGRKRHIVTDCLGLLLVIAVTAANVGYREQIAAILLALVAAGTALRARGAELCCPGSARCSSCRPTALSLGNARPSPSARECSRCRFSGKVALPSGFRWPASGFEPGKPTHYETVSVRAEWCLVVLLSDVFPDQSTFGWLPVPLGGRRSPAHSWPSTVTNTDEPLHLRVTACLGVPPVRRCR